MPNRNTEKTQARIRRKKHIRKVVRGTKERPRLVVFRSLRNVYAQLVDDVDMVTITGVSSLSPTLKQDMSSAKTRLERSQKLGEAIAKIAKDRGFTKVVFDRNGFPYHGHIKAIADSARKAGLEF
jgi:large subunit ribosomal protein L18